MIRMTVLWLALVLAPLASAFADEQAELSAALDAYKKAAIAQDAEAMMGFVYPGFFTLIPRDELKQLVGEMYESGRAPKITAIDYQNTGPLTSYSKGMFTIVTYQVTMELPRPGDATPQIDQMMIDLMKEQMGEDITTEIDEEKSVLRINRTADILLVNEEKSGWKVIEKQRLAQMKEHKVLPKDLMDKLN